LSSLPNASSGLACRASMTRELLFLAVLSAPAPEVVQQRWQEIEHVRMPFVQRTYWSFLGQTKMVRGELWFKSPNHFRVALSPPDSQLIVSNGDSLWVWTPEVGYVTRSTAPARHHPISWIVGEHALCPAEPDSAGLPGFTLELPDSSPWVWAAVWVDPVSFMPLRLRLRDRSDRTVTYHFPPPDTLRSPPDTLFRAPP
jgi:outer membrane lipoprotein-sorting protein